ncbi:hypothetical protein G6F56_001360 [Rhizopus delemar]|nr:hypothetical protein G6F56_001360 [Rhizopus delemar]
MEIDHVKVTVPESAQDMRVRKFISQNYRHIIKSKESIHRAFSRKEITINGSPTEETRKLNTGDIVEIKYDPTFEETKRLLAIPIETLYQDEHLAVVWKPSGQNVQIFEKVIHLNTAQIDDQGNKQKVWCINEIQKAASGLILVAKTEQVKQLLSDDYNNDKIDLCMRVICHGGILSADLSSLFTLNDNQESLDPTRLLKSTEIISLTRSNNAQFITTLDLQLHSPLSSLQLRKLFYFQSQHPIVGESTFTRALHVNKDKGLYASLIHMRFQHPVTHEPIDVRSEEPSKFKVMRERELKFYTKKIQREQEAMQKAGIVEPKEEGELLAYVLGQKEFCQRTFKVTRDCLIPRAASETLVRAALDVAQDRSVCVLDVGTGCGNLMVSIMASLSAEARGVALDISEAALLVAQENGRQILGEKEDKRIEWRLQSMTEISDQDAFDILVCNPPYLDYHQISKKKSQMADLSQEPSIALFAEESGLQWYRVLNNVAPKTVKKNGRVILECGKGMIQQVLNIWSDWEQEKVYKDLQGWDRCIVLKRKTK